MSTRSRIGIEGEDGTLLIVSCHWDGYPAGVGATLLEHHNSAGAALALVELGGLAICAAPDLAPEGSQEGGVVSYRRWRGETGVDAEQSTDRDDYLALLAQSWGQWAYLYGPRGWEFAPRGAAGFHALTPEAVAAEEAEDDA